MCLVYLLVVCVGSKVVCQDGSSEDTIFDWLIKITDRESKLTSKELVKVNALDEAVTEAILLGGQ